MSALRLASNDSLWGLTKALMHIRDNGPHNPAVGICTNVSTLEHDLGLDDYYKAWHGELGECFKSWPMYSGNYECPVPDVVNAGGRAIRMAAHHMYWHVCVAKWPRHMVNSAYHYLHETPYAEDRVRLLNWCIEKVREELARRLEVFVC